MGGGEALVALAIIALLLYLAWKYFFSGPSIGGTIPTGGNPLRPVDQWKTPPAQITVGEQTTFTFESLDNNPAAVSGAQLTPITGRTVGFQVTPPEVQIVSIAAVAVGGSQGDGSSDANGQITVVIIANSKPAVTEDEVPGGTLIGIPATDTSIQKSTSFTIVD